MLRAVFLKIALNAYNGLVVVVLVVLMAFNLAFSPKKWKPSPNNLVPNRKS